AFRLADEAADVVRIVREVEGLPLAIGLLAAWRRLMPVREIVARYGIRYLLTFENYLPQRFLDELPPADIETFGDYRLYRFTGPMP
ncbi:MAG: hypothetical protein JNL44_19105, partial [Gemmatimonadetes bacterium]|nr:hypothetical protein [Gemmatimonadota bacterium]